MTLSHPQRMQLKKFLETRFKLAELEEIEVFVTERQDSLPGNTTSMKALELVEYARRRVKFPQLFEAIHFKDGSVDLRPYGGPPPQAGDDNPVEPESPQKEPAEKPAASDDYETLELRIGLRHADGTYELSAETNEGGESGSFLQKLPLDDDDFTDLIDYLRDLVAEPDEEAQFGEKIREFLFPPEVWNFYTNRLTAAREIGKKGLRIQLRIDLKSPKLSQIPWEYCRDDRQSFIALNPKTTFVRYIPTNVKPESISVPDKVRILIAMASPDGMDKLDVAEEDRRIRDALKKLETDGKVEIQTVSHTTRLSLWEAFSEFNPHILHFTGHGVLQADGTGALIFEDDDQQPEEVDANDLMEVLRANESIKMVILSACQTAAHGSSAAIMGIAPRLVWDGLPAAIAMQFKVPEKTALQFMKNLYKSLAQGNPLDTAVSKARIGARFVDSKSIYWAIPVLFMRAPNGNIWQ